MGNKHGASTPVSTAPSEPEKSLQPLYEACRDGDQEQVRELLPQYSRADLNRQRSSEEGNTCLHIAAANGHDDIVQMLIEAGCYRANALNDSNQTAYDLACLKGESTRALFLRREKENPEAEESSRFFEDDGSKCFDFVQVEKKGRDAPLLNNRAKKADRQPNIETFKTEEEKQHQMEYAASSKAMCQSTFGRFCVNHVHSDEPLNTQTILRRLHNLLNQIDDKECDDYLKVSDLIKNFENSTSSIEHLIHLYTLETKFYRILHQDSLPLALPLFMHLRQLKHRFFRGRVYRGVHLSKEILAIYHSAMETPGTVLQTNSFASTSMDRHVAEQFAYSKAKKPDGFCAIFIYDFPEVCDQAINLSRISTDIPALSEYEDEEEVLVLPYTLFEVTDVRHQSNGIELYTIHLTNTMVPKKGLMGTFRWTFADLRHQLRRSREVKFECAFQKYRRNK